MLTSFLPSATASGPLRKPHSGKASPCETLGFFLLLFGLCRPSKLKKNTETPMLCHWPVVRTQPNSRVPRLKYGRGAGIRARFFRLEPGLPRGLAHTDLASSPIRSVWRFHVPRIWIRSINGRKYSVKRKTQNVVDVFVLRLFVVV